MRSSFVAFAILLASGVSSSSLASEVASDELSLLQAGASAKAGAGVDSAVEASSPFCSEEEMHFDLLEARSSGAPLVPQASSKTLQPLESFEVAPSSTVVLIVRAALLLLSLGFFASGATRWFSCDATGSLVAEQASTAKVPVDVPQRSDLHEAALAGDDVRCESLLLRHPKSLAAADSWGTTALHAAAVSGAHAVAELFLEHGAAVDPVDAWDETPLHLAAREGHVEVCELLVQRGASLRAVNAEDMPPLIVAALAGQEAVCKRLLSLGAGAGGLSEEEMPDMLRGLMVAEMIQDAPRTPGGSKDALGLCHALLDHF